MPALNEMVKSLGFYIFSLRNHDNITREAFLEKSYDYRAFISPRADEIRNLARFTGMEILPPEQITLTPDDCREIVTQIYEGVNINHLGIPYPAPVQYQNQYASDSFDRYIANLGGDERTRNSVNEITGRIDEILGSRTAGQQRISGLVVGRVQSGKTRNYIGLMLKAAAEGWNVIIVLTSNITALGDQTRTRIRDEFKEKAHAGNTAIEVDFNAIADNADRLSSGRDFIWGTALKNVSALDNIIRWFQGHSDYQNRMRVLIIDDEADNSSPDTGAHGQPLTEDELDEKIRSISDLNPPLGNWFRQIEDAELSESSQKIISNILQNGTAKEKQRKFLECHELAQDMSLDDFVEDNAGNRITISQVIGNFFNRGKGGGENIHNRTTFVRMLESIFDVNREQSQINSKIRQIIDRSGNANEYTFKFEKCAYIGYTATPYACIFHAPPGTTPLFPDFIYSLGKSPEHFGLQEIFGLDPAHLDDAATRMNIVTPFDKNDQAVCDLLRTMVITENVDAFVPPAPAEQPSGKNGGGDAAEDEDDDENAAAPEAYLPIDPRTLVYRIVPTPQAGEDDAAAAAPKAEEQPRTWESLKHAIAWAFCTAAARRWTRHGGKPHDQQSGDKDDCWTTMLLNLDHRQEVHGNLKNLVDQYIRHRIKNDRDKFIEECRTEWEEIQTGKFTYENFTAIFPDRPEPTPYPEWKDVSGELEHFLNGQYKVIQINSTADGQAGQNAYADKRTGESETEAKARRRNGDTDILWIVCGGNKISRGLTLSGLTASYFNRVRETTAVDTFTQMGRWFGYRRGYELLPRIWMPQDTIGEYKRAALCEEKMHDDIADAFASHRSPVDGENFMTFQCWNRKLSLRAFCTRVVGAIASSSNWISAKEDDARGVLQTINDFLSQLPLMDANEDRQYPDIPVWPDVPAKRIREFLSALKRFYPSKSGAMFEALRGEIALDLNQLNWDVVSGSSRTDGEGCRLCGDVIVTPGEPEGKQDGDTAKFNGARTNTAWFAMIDKRIVNEVDCEILRDARATILKAIGEKIQVHGGRLPSSLNEALPEGDTLEARFDRLIENLKNDNYSTPVPSAVHGLLGGNSELDGYRNRSSHEYQNLVYAKAGHPGPTLQIYPIKAPDGTLDIPLFSISVFWPNHQPYSFFTIATGVPDLRPVPPAASAEEFFAIVRDVLERAQFPLQRNTLLDRVQEGLRQWGRRLAHDQYFAQNIQRGVELNHYRKFPHKPAYYPVSWAKSEAEAIQKRDEAFLAAAREEIRRHPHEEIEAATLYQTIAPKFVGFEVKPTTFNALCYQDGVIAAWRTSDRPIKYKYSGE